MRHLFSLLMAVCMMGSILPPSAQAANIGHLVNKPVAGLTCIDLDGQIADIIVPEEEENVPDSSDVVVTRGMRALLTGVSVYPAIIDSEGTVRYSSSVGHHSLYLTTPSSPTAFINISSAETSRLISQFTTNLDLVPTVWLVIPVYGFYSANDGSYPTYFDFELTAADGTVTSAKVTLSKTATTATIPVAFPIPQGETDQYTVSIWGGFYYYNGSANSEGSSMAGVKVSFNV